VAGEDWVDGNALGGALREVFAVDVTNALGRCAGCGQIAAVAEARVYRWSPGVVARCASCDTVLLRLVRSPDRAFLDLHGLTCLEFALPSSTVDI
jgi:hypothetical protein